MIRLSAVDLSIAAGLIVILAILTVRMQLGMTRSLLVASARTTVQLLLLGLVLREVFAQQRLVWIGLMALVMLLAAGREVMARQERRLGGWWGFGVGTTSMFLSSFAVALLALLAMVGPTPWYDPQYAIPLLGMLLGNTMNGIALALDRLTDSTWEQREMIEQRLMLGSTRGEAIGTIRRASIRSGMIPIVNAMAAAGIVSLPGMMTGQILAGAPPMEAVKYQILIMFLIASGSGFGTVAAVALASRRLFDDRHRLRLDRLRGGRVTSG
ncbi:MAG: iron export ABC transporter permease subunit FetB [Candidatus Eisenbacteria bacterium]|nr:iron export ABC transporter permease subunit FetB [Candidatus Latescibacterota bacterium]MBD3301514.1 iron export ABC transporter permease subunit FetB [Candidatus Eisenbacteria bacterium]